MTVDEEIIEYLEHFGVKGMHWGVRNKPTSTPSKTKPKKEPRFTKEQKRDAAVLAVIGGVVIASSIMKYRADIQTKNMKGLAASASFNNGRIRASEYIKANGAKTFSAIPMPPVRTASSRVSSVRWLDQNKLRPKSRTSPGDVKALRASIANSVKLANADLRARDNKNNVPFAQRSYIKEWD